MTYVSRFSTILCALLVASIIGCTGGFSPLQMTDALSQSSVGTPLRINAVSSSSWQNFAIPSMSVPFTLDFDAIPNGGQINALTSLSAGPASSQAPGAVVVRFNSNGLIDVKNGNGFSAAVNMPYSAGVAYHFHIDINVPAKIFTVLVTADGGLEQIVAANYPFNGDVASFNDFAIQATTGSHNVFNVSLGIPINTQPGSGTSSTPVPPPLPAPTTFTILSPSQGAAASGTIQVTGVAGSQWLNVAAYDTSGGIINYSAKVSADVTPVNSTFLLQIDTTLLANGSDAIAIVAFSTPAGVAGGTSTELDLSLSVNNIGAAPARSGFTLQTQESFTSINPYKWMVQEGNSPAAINMTSDPSSVYGEAEANLPNQYVLIPGGGVRIVSTHQSWSNIGGVSDRQCADPNVSYCSFPWISSQFSGKGGLQSGYGYYEWAAKLPVVPAGGLGTWPATWLIGGQNAPQYEEIDFMERFANDPSHIVFHLHYGGSAGDNNNDNSISFCAKADPTGHNWSDLHTYAVDWEPTMITGYIDGVACGTVRQGDAPNEYGSAPAIIPSGLMFPIFNTAIAPDANAITAAHPVNFDVMHYWYYSSNSNPVAKPVVQLAGIQVDKAYYNPGDTVTVSYLIMAGANTLTNVALSGIAVMDFLGDSSSFMQGSTINGVFGEWMYFQIPNQIATGASYQGSFTYSIPSSMKPGVYTIYMGNVEVNGTSYPGNYGRFVVGANALPPAPVYVP